MNVLGHRCRAVIALEKIMNVRHLRMWVCLLGERLTASSIFAGGRALTVVVVVVACVVLELGTAAANGTALLPRYSREQGRVVVGKVVGIETAIEDTYSSAPRTRYRIARNESKEVIDVWSMAAAWPSATGKGLSMNFTPESSLWHVLVLGEEVVVLVSLIPWHCDAPSSSLEASGLFIYEAFVIGGASDMVLGERPLQRVYSYRPPPVSVQASNRETPEVAVLAVGRELEVVPDLTVAELIGSWRARLENDLRVHGSLPCN